MGQPSKKAVVKTLLDEHGTTYCREAGFTLKDTPSPLFRLLCLSVLLSARIGADIAVAAARALADQGWTTPEKLADSTWEQRAKVLNEAGYARYDERTSSMLGDVADLLLEQYGGDLRKLRDAADRDPTEERTRLEEFKGIGDTGVDIFFREVQAVWEELVPFADDRTLRAARRLDLGSSAHDLAELVSGKDLPRLVAALVRVELDDGYDDVRDHAA